MAEKIIDYYELMQISEKASDEVIKAAYRALSKKYHPDGESPDVMMMQQINTAYEILTDPVKRKRYDEKLHAKDLTGRVYGDHAGKRSSSYTKWSADTKFDEETVKRRSEYREERTGNVKSEKAENVKKKTARENAGETDNCDRKGGYMFFTPEETYGPCREEITSGNDNLEIKLGWVSNLLHNGQFKEAKDTLTELKKVAPRDARVHVGLLLAEFKLHRFDELGMLNKRFDDSENYNNAVYYADEILAYALRKYAFDHHAKVKKGNKEVNYIIYICGALAIILLGIVLITSF